MQVLEMAKEMKLLKLETISLDATKVQADASCHSAMTHRHIEKTESQLKAEAQELLKLVEQRRCHKKFSALVRSDKSATGSVMRQPN